MQFVQVKAALLPQTSQSASSFGGGTIDAASGVRAGADADTVDEDPPSITPTNPRAGADATGEGVVSEGVDTMEDVSEVDGVAALGGFPPFFFMAWFGSVLLVRRAVAGATTASVQHALRVWVVWGVGTLNSRCRLAFSIRCWLLLLSP